MLNKTMGLVQKTPIYCAKVGQDSNIPAISFVSSMTTKLSLLPPPSSFFFLEQSSLHLPTSLS